MGKFNGKRRRRSSKRRRRRRKKTTKSVKTIRKIAKSAAKAVLKSQVESFNFQLMIGPQYDRFATEVGALLDTAGCHFQGSGVDCNALQWGPKTVFAAQQAGGQVAGERLGREIWFSGLQFRLMLRLPRLCPKAKIHIKLVKTEEVYIDRADQIFGNPTLPWVLIKDLPARKQYSVIAEKTFYLKHASSYTGAGTASDVVIHPRFFMNVGRKVLYKETPTHVGGDPCVKEDFLKGHYQVFMYSDTVAHDPNAQNPPDPLSYPQINGAIGWCYRDF